MLTLFCNEFVGYDHGSNDNLINLEQQVSADATKEVTGKDADNGCHGCSTLQAKYNELKKSYIALSVRHTDHLMKYDELLKKVTISPPQLNADQLVDAVPNTVSGSASMPDDIFTANEVRYLESLPMDKKKDSTFVLQCVRYAYKNAESLTNKTLRGTAERVTFEEDGSVIVQPGKDSLTPEKVKRIEQLFIERVSKSKCMAVEYGERVKQSNINKHIASAIKNLAHKKPNQNVQLNL